MKNRSILLSVLILATIFLVPVSIYAVDRTSPFTPGETIDPGAESIEPCGPTDDNCFPTIGGTTTPLTVVGEGTGTGVTLQALNSILAPLFKLLDNGNATLTGNLTAGGVLPGTQANTTEGIINTTISSAFGNAISIDLGQDDFSRIAYFDADDSYSLKFVRCINEDCTSPIVTTVVAETGGYYYGAYFMSLASDDFARILYDDPDGNLQMIRCLDNNCSTKNINEIDGSGNYNGEYGAEVTFGLDGFPRIVYAKADGSGQYFARCTDADCTSPIITSVGGASRYGYSEVSVDIASDGFPRIVYAKSNDTIELLRCTDADCTSPVATTLINDPGNSPGYYGSIVRMGSDGFPRVAFVSSNSDYDLSYLVCSDADCTSPTRTDLTPTDGSPFMGYGFGLRSGNLGSIMYENSDDNSVHVINCTNNTCSTFSDLTIDDREQYLMNYGGSLVIGADNLPLVAYTDNNTGVYFSRLGTADGVDIVVGSDIGESSNPFGKVYSSKLYISGTDFSDIWGMSGSDIYHLTGNVGIGTDAPLSTLNVNQASSTSPGIFLTGTEYYQPENGNDSNEGVAIILAVNRPGNRQLWIGDTTALGSPTLGFFRYQTGLALPAIDAVTGDGLTRLNVTIGNPTKNVAIGFGDGLYGLPSNKLTVAGNFSVGTGYVNTDAPTNGAIFQGNVGIGTTTPWKKLSVAGAVSITGLTASGGSDNYLCLSTNNEVTTGASCPGSSERFKHNIETLSDNLDEILKFRPVTFEYNDVEGTRAGLIAEEVNLIDSKLVFYDEDGTTPRGVRYQDFVPVIIGAIQEDHQIINGLINWIGPTTTPISEDQASGLLAFIRVWFSDTKNGIVDFFANRIHTQTLCIGTKDDETCIDKAQLDSLLNGGQPSQGGTTTETPTEPDPVPTNTPETTNPTIEIPPSSETNVETPVPEENTTLENSDTTNQTPSEEITSTPEPTQ